jgi:RND family efflux transporter MFP subunit
MKFLLRSFVLVSLLLFILQGCGKPEEAKKEKLRPVKAIEVASQKPFGGRLLPGQAKAAKEANLSFRVPGTLQTVSVVVGDEVKKDTLLAQLDPNDYQLVINDAKAQLSTAIAQKELSASQYNRVARVFKKDPGAISKSTVDERKAALDSATAQVKSAKASVQKSKDNLRYTFLRAPFDGTVVEQFVENYEEVQAMQQIIRIVNTQQIEFTIQIPESLMQYSEKVTKAYVVFDAKPEIKVPAKVKEIGKEASRTTRTYPITLIMGQPGPDQIGSDEAESFRILPGMAGKAGVEEESAARISAKSDLVGVEIPMSAMVASKEKGTHVWVIEEQSKRVEKRDVEVIKLTENGALVKGLNPGEWIVTAGANTLVADQKVRILP